MMKTKYETVCDGSVVHVKAMQVGDFDPDILSSAASQEVFLSVTGKDIKKQSVSFSVDERISLSAYLQMVSLTLEEALRFFYDVIWRAQKASGCQPAILDPDFIFLDKNGADARFVRVPLRLELWMHRKEERKEFLYRLLQAYQNPRPEICGLLWVECHAEGSFDVLCGQLHEIFLKISRRFPFHHPVMTPYQAKKPVVLESVQPPAEPADLPRKPDSEKPEKSSRTASEENFSYAGSQQSAPRLLFVNEDKPASLLEKDNHEEICVPPQEQIPLLQEEPPAKAPTQILEQRVRKAILKMNQKQFLLDQSPLVLGRDQQCDLCLDASSVSARHCVFSCSQQRWYVQDLKSTNGTMLNGKKVVRKMRLRDGMQLIFGDVEAEFHE